MQAIKITLNFSRAKHSRFIEIKGVKFNLIYYSHISFLLKWRFVSTSRYGC